MSDLILDEEDEDVRNLVDSTQSDVPILQQGDVHSSSDRSSRTKLSLTVTRSASSSKRTRRSSKTSVLNDRNNEFIFDDEHLIELLKRLKPPPGQGNTPMTSDEETTLVETLISKSCCRQRDPIASVFHGRTLPVVSRSGSRTIRHDLRNETYSTERIHTQHRQYPARCGHERRKHSSLLFHALLPSLPPVRLFPAQGQTSRARSQSSIEERRDDLSSVQPPLLSNLTRRFPFAATSQNRTET